MVERTASCPSCSRRVFPNDAFCSWCGTRTGLAAVQRSEAPRTFIGRSVPTGQRLGCPHCHGPVLEDDLFCSECGNRREEPVEANAITEMWASILRTLEEATRGRFDFIREIGRGGMGTVYLARQLDLDRLVAIKVLSPTWLTNETMVERFRREARLIASIRHPSIVNVHGVGQTADVHYFVMDFIEGVPLNRVLRSRGQLSAPVSRAVLYQVGAALAYAHRPERGIIHRDIKPGNILLDSEGNAVVTDFGIARASDASSGLTMTGLIMGTPQYMSPEQCRGEEVTPASDQYSLGAVLYAMLAGRPPFTGTDYQILIKQTTEPVPPLRGLRPNCPDDLADAVERMLAKEPEERWPTVSDAVKAAGATPLTGDDPVRAAIVTLVKETLPDTAEQETVVAHGPVDASAGSDTAPTWLRILSLPTDLSTGDEVDLSATCILGDGTEHENVPVVWNSTNPEVAWVDPDTGHLVAVGAGAAVITARAAGVTESVEVKISRPPAAGLDVSPGQVSIRVGETRHLRASAVDERGRPIDRPVQWSSGNPSVASVDDDGIVRALSPGSSSILALCDSVGAASTVTVVPQSTERAGALVTAAARARRPSRRLLGFAAVPVLAITALGVWLTGNSRERGREADAAVPAGLILLVPDSVDITDTVAISARLALSDGDTVATAPIWTSSDESVASVVGNAVVGVAPGVARLTASASGIESRTEMRVFAPTPEPAPTRAEEAPRPRDPAPSREDIERAPVTAPDSEPEIPEGPEAAAPGTLRIRVSPYAGITVSGTPYGDRTQLVLTLPAGAHQVAIARPGYRPISYTVTVSSGDTVDVLCRLYAQESSCENPY